VISVGGTVRLVIGTGNRAENPTYYTDDEYGYGIAGIVLSPEVLRCIVEERFTLTCLKFEWPDGYDHWLNHGKK
jgi:hypothetical protein